MRKEEVGREYSSSLLRLIEYVSQHKLLTFRYLSGNTSVIGELKAVEEKIHATFVKLIQYEQKMIDSTLSRLSQERALNPEEATLVGLQTDWNELQQQVLGSSIEVSDAFHDRLIQSLRSLLASIADVSDLTIDSSADTRHLIDLLIDEIPSLSENIPSLMEFVEGVILRQNITSLEKLRLGTLILLVDQDLKALRKQHVQFKYLFSAGSGSLAEKQTGFDDAFDKLVSSIAQYGDYLTTFILEADTLPTSNVEAVHLGNEVQARVVEFRETALDGFGTLLSQRFGRIAKELTAVVSLTLVGLLVVFVSMLAVVASLNRALGKLVEASTKLAEGDLSASVVVKSKDEIGKAGQAINDMAQALRSMIARLQQAGTSLARGSGNLASTANVQVASMTEQEATAKEISATVRLITDSSKDLAKSLETITATAEETANLALEGRKGLEQMHNILEQMVGGVGDIATRLNLVRDKANEINSIIVTITKVADQTNLLSLNAAVEAEREKEHGKGFAVIAGEIRRLADQVALATLNIEKMINETSAAVSTGVESMEGFTKEFRSGAEQVNLVLDKILQIINRVQGLVKGMEEVSQGMSAQSEAVEEINVALTSLTEASLHSGESIRELQRTLDVFNTEAKGIRSSVQQFKNVDVQEASPVPSQAAQPESPASHKMSSV